MIKDIKDITIFTGGAKGGKRGQLPNHLFKKNFLNAPQPQVHKALIIRSYNLHIIIILIKKNYLCPYTKKTSMLIFFLYRFFDFFTITNDVVLL